MATVVRNRTLIMLVLLLYYVSMNNAETTISATKQQVERSLIFAIFFVGSNNNTIRKHKFTGTEPENPMVLFLTLQMTPFRRDKAYILGLKNTSLLCNRHLNAFSDQPLEQAPYLPLQYINIITRSDL